MPAMGKITKDWLTTAEAAELIGCTTRAVRKMASDGRLREMVINPRMTLVHATDVKREAKTPQPTGRPRIGRKAS